MDIVINLDNYVSIKNAELTLKEIETAINNGVNEFIERLEEKVYENLDNYGLGDSSLASQISIVPIEDGVSIQCGSDHFMFVEFGTGVVGKENPHPNLKKAEVVWEYDSKSHGFAGWWYPSNESDPNPYKKRGKDGTIYAWTRGMGSRPFMYETWLWGTRAIGSILHKHIRRVIKN